MTLMHENESWLHGRELCTLTNKRYWAICEYYFPLSLSFFTLRFFYLYLDLFCTCFQLIFFPVLKITFFMKCLIKLIMIDILIYFLFLTTNLHFSYEKYYRIKILLESLKFFKKIPIFLIFTKIFIQKFKKYFNFVILTKSIKYY